VPGCELKLVPCARKLEVRVRGPNVTPGYHRSPELTAAAFDEEGYYRTGDAVRLADEGNPAKGLVFDGRIAEDFKLSSGTWVHVGAVRVRLIAACDPLVRDAVITGHDRGAVGALVFLNPVAAQGLSAGETRERLRAGLRSMEAEAHGSSLYPTRVLVLLEPPSIDADEITDKGYLNQRAVLDRRAALVDELYAGGPRVITP
jgi:feruloyl-CoA synthase